MRGGKKGEGKKENKKKKGKTKYKHTGHIQYMRHQNGFTLLKNNMDARKQWSKIIK